MHFILLSLVTVALVSFAQAGERRKTVKILDSVETLSKSIPFRVVGIETALKCKLAEHGGNEYFRFYESGACGSDVTHVDLRVKKSDSAHKGFLVLDVGGPCVSLDDIRARFGELELTQTPRHGLPDESTSWTVHLNSCRVSFGFTEKNPKCVASVAFDPQASK